MRKRLLALFLALTLLCPILSTGISAQDTVSPLQPSEGVQTEGVNTSSWKENRAVTELVELRDENTKHFDLGNGLYQAVLYSTPVHKRDASGAWQDIDNTLTLRSKASGARYETADGRISFAERFTPKEALFSLHENGYSVSMEYIPSTPSLENAELSANDHAKKQPTIQNHAKRAENTAYKTVEEAAKIDNMTTVLYEDVEGGTHLEYILTGNGVKENIIVTQRADSYIYHFVLRTAGLIATLTEQGTVLLTDDENGKVRYIIPLPYMKDAAGALSYNVSYDMVTGKQGLYFLSVSADADWINESERAFPVTIDPSISDPYAITEDTYVEAYDRTPNGGEEYMRVNSNCIAFIKTELPSLPDGATISSARMYLIGESIGPDVGLVGEALVNVHQVTAEWSEATLAYGVPYAYLNTPASVASFDISFDASDYISVDITSLVVAWKNMSAQNHGVALTYASGECEDLLIVASEYGSGFAEISITYAHEISEGIYALRMINSTETLTFDDRTVETNKYLYLSGTLFLTFRYEKPPTDYFDKSGLFIISKASGTASGFPTYVIRSLANGYASINVQADGIASAKTISGKNAEVAQADTFSIAWQNSGGFLITQSGTNYQLDYSGGAVFSDRLWALERYVPTAQNTELVTDGMTRKGKTVTLTPEAITSFPYEVSVHYIYAQNASCVWDANAKTATVTWNKEGFLRMQYKYKLSEDGAYKTIGYSYTVLPNEYFIRNKESMVGTNSQSSDTQRNKSNQTFLQAADSMPSQNDAVAAMQFDGERYQKWVLERIDESNYYKIRYSDGTESTADDLFLTYAPANQGTASATVILKLADSAIADYQTWKLTKSASNNYIIQPKATETNEETNEHYLLLNVTSVTVATECECNEPCYCKEWVLAEIGFASNVEVEGQEKSNWCWATASRMFAKHYSDVTKTQREAVIAVKKLETDPSENELNTTGSIIEAKEAINYYTGNVRLDTAIFYDQIFTASAMMKYLDNENVLYVSMGAYGIGDQGFGSVNGHAVLIFGYVLIGAECWVLVKDSCPVNRGGIYMISYNKLCMGIRYDVYQDENHLDPIYPHCEDEKFWNYYWKGSIAFGSTTFFNGEDILDSQATLAHDVAEYYYQRLMEEKNS